MKIDAIEPFLADDKYLLLKVVTDSGLVGYGEGGLHGVPEAAEAALRTFARDLLGKDPLRIEHHFQHYYRFSHFRGAAISAALSAIDIALWDIAGKHFGAPVWQLLGGKVRDRIRLYIHVNGSTTEALAADAARAAGLGFTAVRFDAISPATQPPYWDRAYSSVVKEGVERVGAVREAVGDEVDLCVEIHRRLDLATAIELGRAIADLRPLFYEDPVRPDSIDSMAEVQRSMPVPIATGERHHTIWEFREILERRACRFVRPDVCHAGGITQCKKVAGMAEAFDVGVIPHNPLTPVSTAACVQLDACIPNFVLQEYTGEDRPPKRDMVRAPLQLDGGYLLVPEAPGIGVELDEAFFREHEYRPRPLDTPIASDGSVADR